MRRLKKDKREENNNTDYCHPRKKSEEQFSPTGDPEHWREKPGGTKSPFLGKGEVKNKKKKNKRKILVFWINDKDAKTLHLEKKGKSL